MIEIKTITNHSKQETYREYYTHPAGLQTAIIALKVLQKKMTPGFGLAYLKIDGVAMDDSELKGSSEMILQSVAAATLKQARMGQENVYEINEQEIDKGFLTGYRGVSKTKDNPYYNQGFQSGIKCKNKV